ncbi:hypothetical protein ACIGDI_11380 [Streptomyces sp. NPDC085900]|uniref:hypothetical protein n=1 Tax=Streptomyces sp. NPDC085900 TaxID=3365737 RepID=UPI0037D32B70
MLEYIAGSVPVEPLAITVRDEVGNPRSLSAYTGAAVLIIGPDGVTRTGGTAAISNAAEGQVTYTWPNTVVFDVPGDYRLRLKLTKGAAADYTAEQKIIVRPGLEV